MNTLQKIRKEMRDLVKERAKEKNYQITPECKIIKIGYKYVTYFNTYSNKKERILLSTAVTWLSPIWG